MNESNVESVLYAVGTRGYSAYEVAVQNGFEGTVDEWLESLKGEQGIQGVDGKSAYEVAVEQGYSGTEEEWANSFLSPYYYYSKQDIDNKIVDNLNSNDNKKILSAKQGKVLKENIDSNNQNVNELIRDVNSTLENKADADDVVNNYVKKTDFNGSVNELRSQISGLQSGAPLVASSVSDMTDTTKTYVNTSDGKWYYYNGSAWAIGGVYQGTELGTNSVKYNNFSTKFNKDNFEEINADTVGWYMCSPWNGNYQNSDTNISTNMFYAEKGTVFNFAADFKYRLTRYNDDVNRSYHSGGINQYRHDDTVVIQESAWYVLSLTKDGTALTPSDGNSTNVQFTAYRLHNTGDEILKNVNFEIKGGYSTQADTFDYNIKTRMYSDKIIVGKGTKLYVNSLHKKTGCIRRNLDGTNIYGYPWFQVRSNPYILEIDRDCIIQIALAETNDREIEESEKNDFINSIVLEYKEPLSLFENANITNKIYNKYHTYFYMGNGGNIEIVRDIQWENNMYFTFDTSIQFVRKYISRSFTMDNLAELFPDNIITFGSKKYFKMTPQNNLVYNLDTNTLEIVNRVDVTADQVSLFECNYGYCSGGALYDMYIQKSVDNGEKWTITTDEYKEEIKDTVNKVIDLSNGNTVNYAFITDLHSDNATINRYIDKQLNSIKEISEECDLDFVCLGGDLTTNYGNSPSYETNLERITEMVKQLANINTVVLPLIGNHDDFGFVSRPEISSETTLDKKKYLSRVVKTLNKNIVQDSLNPNSLYYYYDFPLKKTRIICLDAIDYKWINNGDGTLKYNSNNWWGYSEAQMKWLVREALVTPENNYNILIMSHMADTTELNLVGSDMAGGIRFSSTLVGILNAYNNKTSFTDDYVTCDYTNNTNKIGVYSYGHIHADRVARNATNNIIYTSTSTARIRGEALSQEAINMGYSIPTEGIRNNITEALFDVFVYDKKNSKLNKIRFGNGTDLELI